MSIDPKQDEPLTPTEKASSQETVAPGRGNSPYSVPVEATQVVSSDYSPENLGPVRLESLQQIGPYRIIRQLGAGGMGIVYEAEDIHLHRPVALKVMRPDIPNAADARQRFMQEARAAAAISHDHIVTIYAVGEERGIPYMAMQFMYGETLEDRLEKNPVQSVQEILRIGREMAEGLDAAHTRGLLHRDIKPGNIWLETPRDRVRIFDFGLARASEGNLGLTVPGMIMGTPLYMSPEQSRGDRLDARSDLFSYGCILYQMCTGICPFEGPTLAAVLRNVEFVHQPSADTINPAVSPALAQLIQRLLEKNPSMRPTSAREVVDEIKKIEEEPQVLQAQPPVTATTIGFLDSPTPRNTPIIQQPHPTPVARTIMPTAPTTTKPAVPIVSKPVVTNSPLPVMTNQPVQRPKRSLESTSAEPSGVWMDHKNGSSTAWFRIFIALVLVLGGGGYFAYDQYLTRGTLRIDAKDPTIEIEVFQKSNRINIVLGDSSIRLKPGEYDLSVFRPKSGFQLSKSHVTIQRGATEIVTIEKK